MASATTASTTMAGDIITLENYESKLSKLDTSDHPSSSLFALVDMGSNGIRFSISSLAPSTARLLTCIYRERQAISLYDALHDSSNAAHEAFVFPPKVIAKVASTMARFRRICSLYAVPEHQISVFATEAMRTAHNRDEMLEAIRKASGLKVEMLSPAMESLFGAMGARSAYASVKGLFMDLGGGSMQMTYMDSSDANYDVLAAKAAQSIPFGAARLTEALSEPRTAWTTQADLQRAVHSTFEGLVGQFPALKEQVQSSEGVTIYMCGGGFRGYGTMLMQEFYGSEYSFPEVGGCAVPGKYFVQAEVLLIASRERTPAGLSKRRLDQFPAIVTIVEALIRVLPRIKQVDFCSGGNREGVLFMKLPPAIRETDPLSFYRGGYLPDAGASVDEMASTFSRCLPDGAPSIFNAAIQRYVIRNIWAGMGNTDEANAAKCLNGPVSGLIEGLSGLSHETRAVVALIMVARWAAKLGPADEQLYESLQSLIENDLEFWCEYIGTVGRLFGMLFPNYPANEQVIRDTIFMSASMEMPDDNKKIVIKLKLRLGNVDELGVTFDDINSLFKRVGKKYGSSGRVEIELSK